LRNTILPWGVPKSPAPSVQVPHGGVPSVLSVLPAPRRVRAGRAKDQTQLDETPRGDGATDSQAKGAKAP
jgi:hypothetical protein